MRKLVLSLLLCLIALPAWALSDPAVSAKDTMDRTVSYDPHNRVPLVIQQGGLVVITFDTMETIEQVVKINTAPFTYSCDQPTADQKQQCEQSYTNNLPLIGQSAGSGDLIVLTRNAATEGKERSYIFAVQVIPADSKDSNLVAQITKHLTFTYAGQDTLPPGKLLPARTTDDTSPPPPKLTPAQRKAQADIAIMTARMMSDVTIGPQNGSYLIQTHDRNIAPVGAVDNYHITGFRYPGNMPLPSVFKVMDDPPLTDNACNTQHPFTEAQLHAPEAAVNPVWRNDFLIVQETWPHWRIRSGDYVADIRNCDYNAIGNNPGTGTDSPQTVRRVIQQ